MDTPNNKAEQKPQPVSPAQDAPSDLEIIEIQDSPVKNTGSPKASAKKRKPATKPEVQMAPMFSQMAAASSSAMSGQQLKRKRGSADDPTGKGFDREDGSIGQLRAPMGQAAGTSEPRVDPLKAVQP
jgi:hypothetical protein